MSYRAWLSGGVRGCPGSCPPAPQSSWSHPGASSQPCQAREIRVLGCWAAAMGPHLGGKMLK